MLLADDMAETAIPEVSMEVRLQNLLTLGSEKAKSNAKISGGVSLEKIKAIANYLGLSKAQSKSKLVDSIFGKVQKRQELVTILHNKQQVEVGEGNFRKDKNTFPRVCNTAGITASSSLFIASTSPSKYAS